MLNILLLLVFEIEQVSEQRIETRPPFWQMRAKLTMELGDVLHQIFVEWVCHQPEMMDRYIPIEHSRILVRF